MLCTVLQSVPVLQVGIVAFRDPLGAIEETPAAAGDHSCAVTVAWAGRKGDKDENSVSNPVMKQNSIMFLWLIGIDLFWLQSYNQYSFIKNRSNIMLKGFLGSW